VRRQNTVGYAGMAGRGDEASASWWLWRPLLCLPSSMRKTALCYLLLTIVLYKGILPITRAVGGPLSGEARNTAATRATIEGEARDMAYILSLLPTLACPVGMGLLMWVMMRGTTSQAAQTLGGPAGQVDRSTDTQVAALRAQRGTLDDQQATIAAQIQVLAAQEDGPVPMSTRQSTAHGGGQVITRRGQ